MRRALLDRLESEANGVAPQAEVETNEGESTETPVESNETTDAPVESGTGLKIEKDRPEQNGIKRPSAGGKCRAVWDALDEVAASEGGVPSVTSKHVKALAETQGWNANNASIEFYNWRKYNGVTGRVKATQAA
jgi:hypothetical protein